MGYLNNVYKTHKKKGSTNVGHLLKIGIDSQQLLEWILRFIIMDVKKYKNQLKYKPQFSTNLKIVK